MTVADSSSSAVLELARAVATELGADRVLRESSERRLLERDMGDPPAVLGRLLRRQPSPVAFRPRGAREVALMLRLAREGEVALTPRGLSSAGLGAAVPLGRSAVLDLSWLRGIEHLDRASASCRAAAGTTFFFLGRSAARAGLRLAAQPTNAFGTLGGWASAGGLGLGSLAAGAFCQQVDALDVVLPDGRLERLTQRDRGFSDFFDTEGQLGVITSLQLRLERAEHPLRARAFVLPDPASATRFVREQCASAPAPRSVLWLGRAQDSHPLGSVERGELVVVERPANEPSEPRLPDNTKELPASVAASIHARRFFPLDVESGPLFLAAEAILPVEHAAQFVVGARESARRHGTVLHEHAHAVRLGERHALLVLLVYPCDPAKPLAHLAITPLSANLTRTALTLGGHPYGVGIWNTPLAHRRFPDGRFEALAARKRSLDPGGLLNPGKLFGFGPDARWLKTLLTEPQYSASLRVAAMAAPGVSSHVAGRPRHGTTAERCIWCGACVPVCPAVESTRAESVSARAKLDLLRRLDRKQNVASEELLGSQRCLYCGQCEEVCARGLELVAAWSELERQVRQRVGDGAVAEVARRFAADIDETREPVLRVALP